MTSATPILDRLAPLPAPARSSAAARWMLGAWIAAGVALPVLLVLWQPSVLEPLREWIREQGLIALGLPLLLVVPLAITIHELGHMLAALAAGFHFSQLRIGPLQIDRPVRLSWQRSSGTGYLGWASLYPGQRDHLRGRALVYVAGGPGINLASAGLLLALPYAKGFASWAFIVVSIGLAVRELLPIRHRNATSDGRRIALMLQNPEWNRRWLALMQLVAELRAGALPEALSSEWLADAVAYRDDSPDTVAAQGLAFSAAFHRHEDDEAARRLETALRYSPFAAPVQREGLMSEAGVFQARRRRRADLAEQWLADMPPPTGSRWLRARVEAAILEARGEVAGARQKLAEIEQEAGKWPDRMRRDLVVRLLERWRSELAAR